MKMAECDSITIKVGAEKNDNIHQYVQPQDKTRDESTSLVRNGQEKMKIGQPTSEPHEVVDLTDTNSPDDAPDVRRTVIDLLPVAKEMRSFTNREADPVLNTTYMKLPLPMQYAITKTSLYRFQRRPALPDDPKEYSPKAQFYIDLLNKHNSNLADEPFNLIALKCAYCSNRQSHVPGCCSFIRITKSNRDMPRLLADALHQRLLHLRNTCDIARREHGADVFSIRYNREDTYLQQFLRIWLEELYDCDKTHVEQQITPPPVVPALSATAATRSAVGSSSLSSIDERARILERARLQSLDDRTLTYMNNCHESVPPFTNRTVGPATSNYAQAKSYAILQHLREQSQQRLVANAINYPSQFNSYTQLAPHERHLLIQRNHQQAIRQQQQQQQRIQQIERLRRIRQLKQQKQQQHKQQEQQQQQQQQQQQRQQQRQQQQQKQKPRQRPPQIFPRNKKIPFEDLLKMYETGWEDSSWSVFNPPYNSDDDDDEADDYFNAINENTKQIDHGSENNQNTKRISSYKMILPPLPQPKKNLDYCLPIQPSELARCPRGVPFLEDEEIVTIPKNSRGRPRQPSLIDVSLPNVKSYDVVMACDGCPTHLIEALNDLIGNRHFLRLVSDQRNKYISSSSDTERLSIVKRISKEIQKRKGSFLKASATKTRCRTWKTSDKEAEDYTRFRLEQGFPDILNNPSVGKRTFRCAAPLKGSRSSTTPGRNAAKEPNLVSATSHPVEPSSRNDTYNADVSTVPATPSTTNEALDFPILPSKVFGVRHAPKIGLTNGFLEWNNNKNSNNPSIKFSDLQLLPPRTSRVSINNTHLTARANNEHGDPIFAVNEDKKLHSANASQTEAKTAETSPKKDGAHPGEIVIEQTQESGTDRQYSELDEQLEKKQRRKESNKRNLPDSVSSEGSESPSAKRSRNKVDSSAHDKQFIEIDMDF